MNNNRIFLSILFSLLKINQNGNTSYFNKFRSFRKMNRSLDQHFEIYPLFSLNIILKCKAINRYPKSDTLRSHELCFLEIGDLVLHSLNA